MRWSSNRREIKSDPCQVNRPLFDKTTFQTSSLLCLFLQSSGMVWTQEKGKDLENLLTCLMVSNKIKSSKKILTPTKKQTEALFCSLINSQKFPKMLVEKTLNLNAIKQGFDERMKSNPKSLKTISKSTSFPNSKNRKWSKQKSKLSDRKISERFKRWLSVINLMLWKINKITQPSSQNRSRQKNSWTNWSMKRKQSKVNTCKAK